jgi:hypothetical protein
VTRFPSPRVDIRLSEGDRAVRHALSLSFLGRGLANAAVGASASQAPRLVSPATRHGIATLKARPALTLTETGPRVYKIAGPVFEELTELEYRATAVLDPKLSNVRCAEGQQREGTPIPEEGSFAPLFTEEERR